MVIIVYVLVLVAILALFRVIIPEIYIVTILFLAILASIAAVRKNKFTFIYTILTIYIIIGLSWVTAAHFKTLPRDDIYHYYPFTRYVYEENHFSQPGMEKDLEQLFLGIVVPWPAWHVILASLSHVMGLDLFYTVQIVQALTTIPLVIVLSYVMGKNILSRCNSKTKLLVPYILAVILPFLSYYVYSNTNPVSRSFASILYIVSIYSLYRIIIKSDRRSFIPLLIVLLSMVFSHPYWCLSGPLNFLLTPIVLLTISKIIVKRYDSTYRIIALISLMALSTSTAWIIYYTYGSRISLASAIETLFAMKWSDIFGENIAKPWLQTRLVQSVFFKVHPLEHIIYWMVWSTDIIPIVISLLGLVISLKMMLHKKIDKVWMLTLSLLSSSILIAIITGVASAGLITRYAIKLVYVPLTILAALTVQELQKKIFPHKTVIRAILMGVTIFFVVTAALSLGTRTYQASFIWSSNISFEDKGMHTTHALPVMRFCNNFCEYQVFNDLLADDSIVRVFLNTTVFIMLSNKVGVMPPHFFTVLSEKNYNKHNVLVIITRGFKPTYWMLRSLTWYHINVQELIEVAKNMIVSRGERLYDNGFSRIYHLP